ncbi:MAG: hypothetical protein EPO68_00065 [Planctomycetota bacterium]|nr:MAG: hypothetical protein EPO68_00065 [Planctomycetota bacterium]
MGRAKLALGLLTLLAAVAATALWLLARRAPDGAIAHREVAEHRAPRAEAPLEPVASATDAAPAARETLPLAAEAAPAPAQPLDASATALRGRLILLDVGGAELPPPDGSFTLLPRRGKQFIPQLVLEVHAGVWSTPLADADSITGISVHSVRCGTRRPIVVEPVGVIPIPPQRELVIRAQLPRETILRVVDAATGTDLSAIALVAADTTGDPNLEHPGNDHAARGVGTELRSPIRLGELGVPLPTEYPWRAFVGARDYAWQALQIDLAAGGERRVALPRAGELELTVLGAGNAANSVIRARRPGSLVPHVELPLQAGVTTYALAGLAPGPLSLHVEIGDWLPKPNELGRVDTEIRASERAHATLEVRAAAPVEKVNAGGRVLLPTAWQKNRVDVALELLDAPLDGAKTRRHYQCTPVGSAESDVLELRWAARDVQVGRYALALADPPLRALIEVPPGGREDFELVVPPPAELHLLVLDAATGEEIVTDRVNWNVRLPAGIDHRDFENARRDPSGRGYRIRAPEGAIQLYIAPPTHLPHSEDLDLASGVCEHTVRLEPGCGFALRMLDGATPIPFPPGWLPEPKCASGTGKLRQVQFGEFDQRVMVSEPGTYEVELPKLAGYKQPTAARIEVAARQFAEAVIQLERENP